MTRPLTAVILCLCFLGISLSSVLRAEDLFRTFRVKTKVKGLSAIGADRVSEITWTDVQGLKRVVQLVTKSSKYNPGWLSQYRYDSPAVVCDAVEDSVGGLTDVFHGAGEVAGSLKQHDPGGKEGAPGSRISWLFQGDNHGILRVEYDLHYWKNKAPSEKTFRVIRDLFFASGTDTFVYALTLDFSGIPKDDANIDSRSPYLKWDWDGSGGGLGPYTGYRAGTDGTLVCADTQNPKGATIKTLGDNRVPYVYEWNDRNDRCEAIIATRTYAELPQGSECWAGSPDPIIPAGTVERDTLEAWKLPYQVGGYSGWIEKMTWQVHYNLGHEEVLIGKTKVRAWPKYSYAVLVLLDRYSAGQIPRLLNEQASIPQVTLSASRGRVVTEASPGPGRDGELTTLVTPGYDPEFRAWRAECAKNRIDLLLDTGASALVHPVLIFQKYTRRHLPGILLDGKKLKEGKDLYASLDRKRSCLYVTLKRTLQGKTRIAF